MTSVPIALRKNPQRAVDGASQTNNQIQYDQQEPPRSPGIRYRTTDEPTQYTMNSGYYLEIEEDAAPYQGWETAPDRAGEEATSTSDEASYDLPDENTYDHLHTSVTVEQGTTSSRPVYDVLTHWPLKYATHSVVWWTWFINCTNAELCMRCLTSHPVVLSPRGQSGLEAKILASASASKLWPRPRPRSFGLGLASISLSYYVSGIFRTKIVQNSGILFIFSAIILNHMLLIIIWYFFS